MSEGSTVGAGEVILQFNMADRFAGFNPGRFTLQALDFDHAYWYPCCLELWDGIAH
jgi:hypothetical protein